MLTQGVDLQFFNGCEGAQCETALLVLLASFSYTSVYVLESSVLS